MSKRLPVVLAGLHLALALTPAAAQPARTPQVVRIWPATPPGTSAWTGAETEQTIVVGPNASVRMVGNVTTPTLTVHLPLPGAATGSAMIVVPGGGFQMLAIDHEGEMVARWLAERGVTAFVLKYRVRNIPGFKMPSDLLEHPERFPDFARSFEPGRPIAIADARQAMRYVRANAGRFGIAPDKVGMIGFSAGAITTMGVILDGAPGDRPNLAAPIYGAMVEDKAPPRDAPPLFLAVAQDDAAVPAGETVKIFSRWTAANLPAELHIYEKGGHGFGMMKSNEPVGAWTLPFEAWLKSHRWLNGTSASSVSQSPGGD